MSTTDQTLKGSTLRSAEGGLIVSCQAYPGEAMNDPLIMSAVAQAVERGGAAAIRAQGIADITAIRKAVSVPLIGLWKDGTADVFITPTLAHAKAVVDAGADVVAIDGTRRARPDGLNLRQTVEALRHYSAAEIMADLGSLEDALEAEDAGVDFLGTTLAGYSGERATTVGPDLELIGLIKEACQLPVIAEGRFSSPTQVRAALDAGAWAVCVGSAITHPQRTTEWFIREALT